MSTIAAPQTSRVAHTGTQRDRGIDLVRAACLVVVVALHALMVGISLAPTGPVIENAAEGHAWFVPLSWFVQIMPLFFIVGGFSTRMAFRSAQARGQTRASFIAARVHRLLGPAILMIGVVGAALVILTVSGLPAELVAEAGFRISQPLWFLGVYLLIQALAPAMISAHERAPLRTIGALTLGVITVDAVAALSGIDAIAFLNLALVWLLVQQLGFWLADGTIDRLHPAARIAIGATALAALAAVTTLGIYPANLYAALNPPSLVLVLLGVVHLMALSLARPALARLAERDGVRPITEWINARSMTIYLWHMPVLIALAGLSLAGALNGSIALPEPGTGAWWLTRPLWIVVAITATALVARVTGGWEHRAMPRLTASAGRVAVASTAAVLSVVVLIVSGITVPGALISVLLMRVALNTAANPPVGGSRQYHRVMSRVRPTT